MGRRPVCRCPVIQFYIHYSQSAMKLLHFSSILNCVTAPPGGEESRRADSQWYALAVSLRVGCPKSTLTYWCVHGVTASVMRIK